MFDKKLLMQHISSTNPFVSEQYGSRPPKVLPSIPRRPNPPSFGIPKTILRMPPPVTPITPPGAYKPGDDFVPPHRDRPSRDDEGKPYHPEDNPPPDWWRSWTPSPKPGEPLVRPAGEFGREVHRSNVTQGRRMKTPEQMRIGGIEVRDRGFAKTPDRPTFPGVRDRGFAKTPDRPTFPGVRDRGFARTPKVPKINPRMSTPR